MVGGRKVACVVVLKFDNLLALIIHFWLKSQILLLLLALNFQSLQVVNFLSLDLSNALVDRSLAPNMVLWMTHPWVLGDNVIVRDLGMEATFLQLFQVFVSL